ncbi:flagellar hook-length control protein FliK [Maricaulis sp.]|uniref:flagellar hook-length control protein FliK n=1 Tax=Maricaulis sp. TaxID=1486257 RepID=UPI0026229ACC|nr:flagellar hook-length control protein FliK [Maricaulis sp.]
MSAAPLSPAQALLAKAAKAETMLAGTAETPAQDATATQAQSAAEATTAETASGEALATTQALDKANAKPAQPQTSQPQPAFSAPPQAVTTEPGSGQVTASLGADNPAGNTVASTATTAGSLPAQPGSASVAANTLDGDALAQPGRASAQAAQTGPTQAASLAERFNQRADLLAARSKADGQPNTALAEAMRASGQSRAGQALSGLENSNPGAQPAPTSAADQLTKAPVSKSLTLPGQGAPAAASNAIPSPAEAGQPATPEIPSMQTGSGTIPATPASPGLPGMAAEPAMPATPASVAENSADASSQSKPDTAPAASKPDAKPEFAAPFTKGQPLAPAVTDPRPANTPVPGAAVTPQGNNAADPTMAFVPPATPQASSQAPASAPGAQLKQKIAKAAAASAGASSGQTAQAGAKPATSPAASSASATDASSLTSAATSAAASKSVTPMPLSGDVLSQPTVSVDSGTGMRADTDLSWGRMDARPTGLERSATPDGARFTPQTATNLAAQIQRRFVNGARVFDIRLDPAELGRVDVRLELSPDQRVQAILTIERPETLAEMQRNARELERALAEAGLDVGDDGLEFQLGGDTHWEDHKDQLDEDMIPVFQESEYLELAEAGVEPQAEREAYGFRLSGGRDRLDMRI